MTRFMKSCPSLVLAVLAACLLGFPQTLKGETLRDAVVPFYARYNSFVGFVVRGWIVETQEQLRQDNTYHIAAMFAPRHAAQKKALDYLSEGIRVSINIPSKNAEVITDVDQLAASMSKGLLASNQGFTQTGSGATKLGEISARYLDFVGQNQYITEPEKARFVLVAMPKCTVTVELVAPVRQWSVYEQYFSAFVSSFSFRACPVWK